MICSNLFTFSIWNCDRDFCVKFGICNRLENSEFFLLKYELVQNSNVTHNFYSFIFRLKFTMDLFRTDYNYVNFRLRTGGLILGYLSLFYSFLGYFGTLALRPEYADIFGIYQYFDTCSHIFFFRNPYKCLYFYCSGAATPMRFLALWYSRGM